MNFMRMIGQALQYLTEAMAWTFTTAEHHYPATGIIPFMGDDYEQSWAD